VRAPGLQDGGFVGDVGRVPSPGGGWQAHNENCWRRKLDDDAKEPRFILESQVPQRLGRGAQELWEELEPTAVGCYEVSGWAEVLKNFGKAYKVQFFVFRRDGSQIAGESITLPAVVAARVAERRGMGEGLGRGPPPGRGSNSHYARDGGAG